MSFGAISLLKTVIETFIQPAAEVFLNTLTSSLSLYKNMNFSASSAVKKLSGFHKTIDSTLYAVAQDALRFLHI